MELTFASYNIHKAVGTDGRRDPGRILAVLHELDADVVAVQEADRRFGRRESVLPLHEIAEHTHYEPVLFSMRPDSIGWHGNALLVRQGIEVVEASAVPLPALEPRGAVRADLRIGRRRVRVAGMHLDLSGLRRRHQLRAILAHLDDCDGHCPTVLMGDFNEWSTRVEALRELAPPWQLLLPGRSFPSRRPLAALDRIAACRRWDVLEKGVHHSPLAAVASDHLPVWARLKMHKF